MSNKNGRLQNAIFLSDYSQASLAKEVGLDPGEMSKAVNRGLRFSNEIEEKIAKLLEKKRREIFEG